MWKALCQIRKLPICNHPAPPIEKSGATRAAALVRKAKDEETAGLAVIARIVGELTGKPQPRVEAEGTR